MASGQGRTKGCTRKQASSGERPSIRSWQLRVGASQAVPCWNSEQVPPACLDDKPNMACHRLPGTGVLPQRNGGKAQAGSDGCQDQTANGPVPDMRPSLPGQHPPLQLVQAPAHPGSPFGLAFHVGRSSSSGRLGIVRRRPAGMARKRARSAVQRLWGVFRTSSPGRKTTVLSPRLGSCDDATYL